MERLKEEYKDTRCELKKAYDALKQLRDEKREQQLKLKAKLTLITTWDRDDLESEIAQLEAEMKLISQMRLDIEYTLEWLETGKRPGNKRGIERRAAYQRIRALDPLIIQSYLSETAGGSNVQLSDRDRDRLEFALGKLSPRERECYEMIRGKGFTYKEVSNLLGIEKSSVQSYMDSADEKLKVHAKQIDIFEFL